MSILLVKASVVARKPVLVLDIKYVFAQLQIGTPARKHRILLEILTKTCIPWGSQQSEPHQKLIQSSLGILRILLEGQECLAMVPIMTIPHGE